MTTHPPTLGALFDHEPSLPPRPDGKWAPSWQWGNRGDPHLWRALHLHFATTPWPADLATLDALLAAAFVTLTGQPLTTTDPIFVPQFAHGGMTSGYVLPAWWREKGLPYVRERFLNGAPPQSPPRM